MFPWFALILLLPGCEGPPLGADLAWAWGAPGDEDEDEDEDEDGESVYDRYDWRDDLPEAGRDATLTEWVNVPPDVSDDVWFAPTRAGACIARANRSSTNGVYCVDEDGNVEDEYDVDEIGGLASIGSDVFILRYGAASRIDDESLVYDGDFIGLGAGDGSLWGIDVDWRLVEMDPDSGRVIDDDPLPDELFTYLDPEDDLVGVTVDDGEVWLSVEPGEDYDRRWLVHIDGSDVLGAFSLEYTESDEPIRFLGLGFEGGDLVFAEGRGAALMRLVWED